VKPRLEEVEDARREYERLMEATKWRRVDKRRAEERRVRRAEKAEEEARRRRQEEAEAAAEVEEARREDEACRESERLAEATRLRAGSDAWRPTLRPAAVDKATVVAGIVALPPLDDDGAGGEGGRGELGSTTLADAREDLRPEVGNEISLVSNSEIRYEGVFYTINTQESTITLETARCFGTEGRKMPDIPPITSYVYDFITFRGQDIYDLTVLEEAAAVAVVAVSDVAVAVVAVAVVAGCC